MSELTLEELEDKMVKSIERLGLLQDNDMITREKNIYMHLAYIYDIKVTG